ncbi:MAG: DUF4174 domain-containing protein [Cytophagales bacterium]|nr:DUF4174 domain-containing protein [Armatimonadota bacterium]
MKHDSLWFRTAFLLVALVAKLCLLSPAEADTPPASLSRYRNRNRVLLIFAPSKEDPRYKKQDRLMSGEATGLKDRDLIRFDVLEQKGIVPLRERYGIRPGQFRVLLIGKDGSIAFSALRPVVASDLFGRIDRMPMRRDEIRRRGR